MQRDIGDIEVFVLVTLGTVGIQHCLCNSHRGCCLAVRAGGIAVTRYVCSRFVCRSAVSERRCDVAVVHA